MLLASWQDGGKPVQTTDTDGSGSSNCSGSGSATRCPDTMGDSCEEDVSGGSGTGGGMGTSPEDLWSRDETGSSPVEGTRDMLIGSLPSLRRDGASANSGSAGHPDDCKPCAFYCYSLRGCRNGDKCSYCHLFHESRLRQRREEWKRAQRDKRRRQRDKRDQGQELQNAADPAAPSTMAATTSPLAGSLRGRAGDPNTVDTAAVVATAALMRAAADAAQTATPAQPQREPVVAVAAGTLCAVPTMRWEEPPLAGVGGTEFFAYTPNSMVVRVGEMVEFWPPLPLVSMGLIFAVSPALPEGLSLDERVGVIYGRPQVGMKNLVTFFVTACKPGDSTFSIKMSMLSIKAIDRRKQEQSAAAACQPMLGSTSASHCSLFAKGVSLQPVIAASS